MDSGRQIYDFIFLPFALIPFWTHISMYRRKVSFTNAGKIMSLPISHLNPSVNSSYFSVPSFLPSTWAGSTPGRLMFHTASGGILFRSDCALLRCPLNRGWHLLVFAHWSLDPCTSFSIHWAAVISASGHVWSISRLEMPFHCLLPSLAKNKGLGHVEKSVMLFLMTCRVCLWGSLLCSRLDVPGSTQGLGIAKSHKEYLARHYGSKTKVLLLLDPHTERRSVTNPTNLPLSRRCPIFSTGAQTHFKWHCRVMTEHREQADHLLP